MPRLPVHTRRLRAEVGRVLSDARGMYNLVTRPVAAGLGLTAHDMNSAIGCCVMRVSRGLFTVWRPCAQGPHRSLSTLIDDRPWMTTVSQGLSPTATRADRADLRRGLHLAQASCVRGRELLLSHRTAALLHGLPILGAPPKAVELVHPTRARRTAARIKRVRRVASEHTVRPHGFLVPATSPAQTVLDLARDLGVEAGLVAADAWLASDLASATDRRRTLEALARDHTHRRHRRRVEAVLAWMTGLAESPAESRALYAVRALGIGPVRQQVPHRLPDGTHARVDLQVDDVVIEVDGWSKYEGSRAMADFRREKRREDGLRALGVRIVRLEWRDFEEAGAVARKLSAAGLTAGTRA